MPAIATELGGMGLYSWAFSVYMIMAAVSTPIWGRVSDVVGKKRIFILVVAIFLGGSALCGLSTTIMQLIVFRGIQGIGARSLPRMNAGRRLACLHQRGGSQVCWARRSCSVAEFGNYSLRRPAFVLQAFTNALHEAFLVGLVCTIACVGVSFLLPPPVLHQMEGER